MSPRVHALSSLPHFREHLAAIFDHLPPGLAGDTRHADSRLGQHVSDRNWPKEDLVMVSSFEDIFRASGHRVIYVEHGAGQSYRGLRDNIAAHYHGGKHPDHVVAYLGPRQDVIDAWGRPGFACGSPVCDPFQLYGEDKVAAITFHWPGHMVCPEAGSAFEHYVEQLPDIVRALQRQGYEVLAHTHPRFGHLQRYWKRQQVSLGVKLADVWEVRERASLLIADNTSLQYEMAYLGREVLVLNCPEYRRDVEHGLRFWQFPPGQQFDGPDELLNFIGSMDELTVMRATGYCMSSDAATAAYGKRFSDGDDGFRAAAWVTQFVAGL